MDACNDGHVLPARPLEVALGFKEYVLELIDNPDIPTRDVVSVLTKQPGVVAYFLRAANEACEASRRMRNSKPRTVAAVVNTLGLVYIARHMDAFTGAGEPEGGRLVRGAIDACGVAKVLAGLAEERLGKIWAPEYFLVGLMDRSFMRDNELLGICNRDLIECYTGLRPGGPVIAEAEALIEAFRKGLSTRVPLYAVWKRAVSDTEELFRSIS